MGNSFSSSWNVIIHTVNAGLSDWGSLHPVLVHIPIALLFVALLFIFIGLVFKKPAKTFYLCALILLTIGTIGIYLATSTGEHASEHIKPNPDVVATLEAHEHLAISIRLNFSILTGIFLTYLFLQSSLSKIFHPNMHKIMFALFLLFYAYNLVLLFNTAHQGGKLVHRHGITSVLFVEDAPAK